MSINDPIVVIYNKRHERWIVTRGNETFYDENECMRTWSTADEAAAWVRSTFPGRPVIVEPSAFLEQK